MLSHDNDPIIALCTPRGKGAIALLRLSGTDVRAVADRFITLGAKPEATVTQNPDLINSQKKLSNVSSHTIHYGWALDTAGNPIDQIMAIVMDAPRTFTGEEVVEITCHNNPLVIDALIARATQVGARLAQEGEFTKRAYLNGKVDLLQAEAINELIAANTQHALKQSLSQLKGSFSHWIVEIEQELIRALAWCEASFEFLDEEQEFGPQIKAALELILSKIAQLKRTFNAQLQIRQGVRIALIGSVNAGKSSLFNALLNQKRSIVTDIPGTTRDVIEAGLYHHENYWTLVDTAGLRQTHDTIEQEGIKRSYEEAQKADIIILVLDSSRALSDQEIAIYCELQEKYPSKCIVVLNKTDLPLVSNYSFLTDKSDPAISASPLLNTGIEQLTSRIEQMIGELFAQLDSPFLLNQRHHGLLLNLEQKLSSIIELLNGTVQYELVSYHLHDALTTLSELTGKSISEAGLDKVFKEFCVGK